MQTSLSKKVSLIYLSLVPLVTAILGFGVGHISYTIYLPVWIINVCLMVTAAWMLGLSVVRNGDTEKKELALGAFFLIVPWILVSIFFGFGPPPSTAIEWTATAVEQQVRYSILVVAGIFIVFGFAVVQDKLKKKGEHFYSQLGFVTILIFIPLFIMNMIFWGYFLTAAFNMLVASGSAKMPEWYKPVRVLFSMISVVEVALTYLATAAFAVSLNRAGIFNQTPARLYVGFSVFAFFIIILSTCCSEPFITAGYAVSIPAIPFIMPYFIGVNLLRRLDTDGINR
jgi:hypothetical protein